MHIQYLSDIHLEFLNDRQTEILCDKIFSIAPIMILSGDIGNPYKSSYEIFLTNMSNKFEQIFIICGNHEYYYNYIEETKIHIKNICNKFSNIIFLDNNAYEYKDYLFVGSTLWSQINNKKIEINDTSVIKNFSVDNYMTLHNICINYITNVLEICTNKKIIMITHHLPSLTLIDNKYKTPEYNDISQWYASDLDFLLQKYNDRIVAWFYGHTHTYNQKNINGIETYCNPVGYLNENKIVHYSASMQIKNDKVTDE